MLITPHPDDEALACGIVLQRAIAPVPPFVTRIHSTKCLRPEVVS